MHFLNGIFGAGWRFRAPKSVTVADVAAFRPTRARWYSRPAKIVLAGSVVICRRYESGSLSRSKLQKMLLLKAEAFEESSGIALAHAASRPKGGQVEQAFVRKRDIEEILFRAEASGLSIECIEAKTSADFLTIFRQKSGAAATWRWWCLGSLLLAAALSWALILNADILEEGEQQLATLTRLSSDLSDRVVRVRDDAQEMDISNGNNEALSELFARNTELPQRLANLTLAIPSDTYVSSLEMTGERIAGRFVSTGDVTEVLEAIERLEWINSVRLTSPVARDTSRQTESFELEMLLND